MADQPNDGPSDENRGEGDNAAEPPVGPGTPDGPGFRDGNQDPGGAQQPSSLADAPGLPGEAASSENTNNVSDRGDTPDDDGEPDGQGRPEEIGEGGGAGRPFNALADLDTRLVQLAVILRGLRSPGRVLGVDREVARRLGVPLTEPATRYSQKSLAEALGLEKPGVVQRVESVGRSEAYSSWGHFERHLDMLGAEPELVATAYRLYDPGDETAQEQADQQARDLHTAAVAALTPPKPDTPPKLDTEVPPEPDTESGASKAFGPSPEPTPDVPGTDDRASDGPARDRSGSGVVVALVAVAVVVVLLAVGIVVLSRPSRASAVAGCAAPAIVATVGSTRECVGRLSDPAALPLALGQVLLGINAENNAVAASGQPAVTLAYALPVATAPASADQQGTNESSAQFAQELEGVRRAVVRANHTLTLGNLPKVRVVLYGLGQDADQWVRVLNDLQREVADDHVVAVAGLGAGLDGAGAFGEALTRLGIPVFASRATAEQLTALRADPATLLRTTTTSSGLAAVAADALRPYRRVVMVQDVRADNRDAASLGSNVGAALGVDPTAAITYDSSLRPAGTDFSNALAARCPGTTSSSSSSSGSGAGAPDAFFVSGRGPQIAEFLISLNTSPCLAPVTVLAGPDGAEVLEQLRQARITPVSDRSSSDQELINAFDHPKFRFRFLGFAHPDLLKSPALDQQAYIDTVASFRDLLGTPAEAQLQGGDALLGYDATLSAITCIRRAANQYRPIVTTDAVRAACATVTTAAPVYGAAGPIGFDPRGHTGSLTVPVVEVHPDGSAPALPASQS